MRRALLALVLLACGGDAPTLTEAIVFDGGCSLELETSGGCALSVDCIADARQDACTCVLDGEEIGTFEGEVCIHAEEDPGKVERDVSRSCPTRCS